MKHLCLSALVVYMLAVAAPVAAATEECTTTTGAYGQTSTTCKVLGETTTTIVHETVPAGVGGVSFWTIAQLLTMISIAGFGFAKLAERTYWLD